MEFAQYKLNYYYYNGIFWTTLGCSVELILNTILLTNCFWEFISNKKPLTFVKTAGKRRNFDLWTTINSTIWTNMLKVEGLSVWSCGETLQRQCERCLHLTINLVASYQRFTMQINRNKDSSSMKTIQLLFQCCPKGNTLWIYYPAYCLPLCQCLSLYAGHLCGTWVLR